MKTETIIIEKLTAAEGMTLTNGSAFGKEVFLGCNDTADNWREITDAAAKELQTDRGEDE